MCAQLASYYNTVWVPEYAREHLLSHGPTYTYNDLLEIAQRQLNLEEQVAANAKNGILFIDTEMYVMKIWCEFVFGKTHQWILDRLAENRYDLYLLCAPDLPWTQDPLREYPDIETRLRLFHLYRDSLINQPVPWQEIRGIQEERLLSAVAATDGMLKAQNEKGSTACRH